MTSDPPDPPAPFRDHEDWVAHQQLLYGGAAWLLLGVLLAAIAFWLQSQALVVETVEGADGAAGFHVDIVGPFFEYGVVFAIGVMIAIQGWQYVTDARMLRRFEERRKVAESAVAITLMGTILQTIFEAAEEQERDADV